MRAKDIIRNIIDLIDDIDGGGTPSVSIAINSTPVDTSTTSPVVIAQSQETGEGDDEFASDDIRRFKQIIDLAANNNTGNLSPFSNAPNEQYADINAVTTDAGGGVNGPKHPSDQRVQHPSLYPNAQWKEE